jgi:hypothetical protein
VYATGDVDDKLMLFAIGRDGTLKWKIAHDRAWDHNYPGARSTPTVDGHRIYLVSGHGLIGCYSTRDGVKIWTRTMQELGGKTPNWGFAESVLIDGDKAVVTPGNAGCITALDKATGTTIWQSQGFDGPAHYGSCTPFTFDKVPMYAAGTGGGLFCIDARNGAKAVRRERRCGGAGLGHAGRLQVRRQVQRAGRRAQLGPSGRHRRAAVSALRYRSVLLRCEGQVGYATTAPTESARRQRPLRLPAQAGTPLLLVYRQAVRRAARRRRSSQVCVCRAASFILLCGDACS